MSESTEYHSGSKSPIINGVSRLRNARELFTDPEALDNLLNDANNFIEDVYRDLNILPVLGPSSQSLGTSASRSSTSPSPPRSPVRPSDIGENSLNNPNLRRSSRIAKHNSHPEFIVETAPINSNFRTPDRNLRSVGVIIENSNASSSSLTVPSLISPLSTSSNNSIDSNAGHKRRRSHANRSIIDLTLFPTPEPLRSRRTVAGDNRCDNCEDDDVVLVSSHNNEVIDLSTPKNSALLHSNQASSPSGTSVRPSTSNSRRRHSRHSINHSSCSEQAMVVNTNKAKKCLDQSSFNDHTLPSTSSPRPCAGIMCPLCMESTMGRQPTSTRCGHVFCQSCILRALEFSRMCPLCKSKVLPKQLLRIYL
uniref:RING-type domain-containing protein n=1 Tax=Glossina brevipalpis TaxID=37001 RepID=A0A1A9WQ51_9MUSC